jgi:signal transduction histidine kinase
MQTFAAQSVVAIENARLFTEIEEKGRQLSVASQHKSQFLANMSHELRTPLNAILGYTELILDDIYGEVPEKMRGVLNRVQTNGKHLLGLINDVLDLSKIEAGQLTLSLADYSINEMVQTVLSEYYWKDEARREKILEEQPIKHLGQPEEIAEMAVLLASDRGSYITGQTINVDGGVHMT